MVQPGISLIRTQLWKDIGEGADNRKTFRVFISCFHFLASCGARGLAPGTARMPRIESALIPPGRRMLATTSIVRLLHLSAAVCHWRAYISG